MRSARNPMHPLRKFKDPRVLVRHPCQHASVEPSPVFSMPKNACIAQALDTTVLCASSSLYHSEVSGCRSSMQAQGSLAWALARMSGEFPPVAPAASFFPPPSLILEVWSCSLAEGKKKMKLALAGAT